MSLKLIFVYAIIAGAIAIITGPVPGTSVVLTLLELGMSYHIAKRNGISLQLSEIGVVSGIIYALVEVVKLTISTLLELFPFVGWYLLKPLVAFVFVLGLGIVLNLYFRDLRRSRESSVKGV